MSDPYRPFPASTAARAPEFPRTRLLRAGLDEATVDRLEGEAAGEDLVDLARFVTANSDDVIRERFTEPAEPEGEVEYLDGTRSSVLDERYAVPTYDDLNALTVDELDDRLREWNEAHPEQHLTIAGRKGEKIGRLLDAYEHEREAATQAPADAAPEPAPVAEQQLPTAPTATTPEGAPQQPADAPAAPAGTVETGNASTGAQEPAQTADAAGAGTAPTAPTQE